MQVADEKLSIKLSRGAIDDIQQFVAEHADRLHYLLERNTDDDLNADERRELESLVYIGQIGQLLALSAASATGPTAVAS